MCFSEVLLNIWPSFLIYRYWQYKSAKHSRNNFSTSHRLALTVDPTASGDEEARKITLPEHLLNTRLRASQVIHLIFTPTLWGSLFLFLFCRYQDKGSEKLNNGSNAINLWIWKTDHRNRSVWAFYYNMKMQYHNHNIGQYFSREELHQDLLGLRLPVKSEAPRSSADLSDSEPLVEPWSLNFNECQGWLQFLLKLGKTWYKKQKKSWDTKNILLELMVSLFTFFSIFYFKNWNEF